MVAEHRSTKVFVSYSRKDRAFVGDIVEALEAADDIEVFRDTDDILPTEEWKDRLEQLIGQADTIVFALSPHSAKSEICSWEVEHAESLNKRIAPIVIKVVEGSDIPAALSKLNYIFFTNKREFNASIQNLITALNTDIDWIREHTRLGELARRWEGQGRPKSQKLRSGDLTAAENWLALQPANAPTPAQLHREFIQASRLAATRRQRSTVGGSLAAAIVAIALAGYALVQQQAAVENERLAVQERDRAVSAESLAEDRATAEQLAKERAEASLRAAIETANGLIVDLAEEFDSTVVPLSTLQLVLDSALALQERLSEGNPTDRRLLASKVDGLFHISRVLYELGYGAEARASADEALVVSRGLLERYPDDNDYRFDLVLLLDLLGNIAAWGGNTREASSFADEGLVVIRDLTNDDPDNTEWQNAFSGLLADSATLRGQAGQNADALEMMSQAVEIMRNLAETQPDVPGWQATLSGRLAVLAGLLVDSGNLDGAVSVIEETLVIANAHAKRWPETTDSRQTLVVLHQLRGDIRLQLGNSEAAFEDYTQAIEIADALLDTDIYNVTFILLVLRNYTRSGEVYRLAGNLDAAQANLGYATALGRRILRDDPGNLLYLQELLASQWRLAIVSDDPVAEWRETVRLLSELEAAGLVDESGALRLTEAKIHLITVLIAQGDSYTEIGEPGFAADAYSEGLTLFETLSTTELLSEEQQDWYDDMIIVIESRFPSEN
jgi:tetratricopeptide (TPR) repeat protein